MLEEAFRSIMVKNNTIKKKVLKVLEEKSDTDSFEISVIIKEPINDINIILEEILVGGV